MTAINYQQICVAVTGLNANDNPGPGVAVIRAIKEEFGEQVKIIGLSYEPLEPGIYMRNLVNKTYLIPYPTAGTAALLDRLAFINHQENIQVIIPNFDAELHNFIKIAPQLQDIGIRTFLPSLEQLRIRDKTNLSNFGKNKNLYVPADQQLFSVDDLKNAAEKLGYPLVIKGKFYDAYIAYTIDAALKAYNQLVASWGYPVIAQQHIKGTEINVAALGDGKGNNIGIVAMRKMYITEKGKAWAGVTIEDTDLTALANNFAKATKWKGGYELELIRDAENRLFILEINPRFPAWIYLAAAAGQNQPTALIKMAMGEEVPAFSDYQSGKLFIRHSWDEVIDITDFQKIAALGEL